MSLSQFGHSQYQVRMARVGLGIILLFVTVYGLATFVFPHTLLGDFTVTFYRAANYVLQEQNVYRNAYPNPLDGRNYPPYSPIWIVYYAVPLALLPLHVAEALRFLLELALLPLLALTSAHWAGLKDSRLVILLAIAPWFFFLLLAGQFSVLVFTALLLSYAGIRRANFWMLGVGLWFLALKPHIVALILLAALFYAWRNRILFQALVVFGVLALVSSLAQPAWMGELFGLTVERLKHPDILDSVRLLPGYPYAQLGVLAIGAIFFVIYFARSAERAPSKWLWSVLVTISLLAGLHSMLYDWLNLMLPLAILMRQRWGVRLTIALYLYPLIWGAFLFSLEWHLLFPTVIPSVILGALFVSQYKQSEKSQENQASFHAA